MKKIYSLLLCILLAKLGSAQCAFTISIDPSPISCNGGANGTLMANLSGGTGPFNFTWKTGSTVLGTTNMITGLSAGVYKVIVYDQGAACTDSLSYTLTQPAPLDITVTSLMNSSCLQPNGYVTTAATGGTAAYTYSLTPGIGNNIGNGTFVNLMAGTYVVTVLDANSCVDSTIFSIMDMPPPMVTTSVTPAHCGQCDGSATANTFGGTPPYSYNWTTAPAQFGQVAQGLCSNTTYTITVTDAMGCTSTNTVYVSSTGASGLTATTVPAACGQSNGSITVAPSAGMVPPVLYSIQGGAQQASPVFSNLSTGIYAVLATDSFGCQASGNVAVNDSTLNLQLNTTTPSCNMCDGSVSPSVNGGTGPYNYQWNNGSQASAISSLCAGTYYVEVTDANGCYSAAMTTLAPPNAPVIQVDTVISASCVSNLGSIQVSASGGTGAYTYLWQPGGNTTSNPALTSGSYTVTVTDAGGCSSAIPVYLPNTTNVYVYTANMQQPNCTGNNGAITVNEYGGIPPYTYAWNTGATTNSITGLTPGMYSVTVTDANGCMGNGNFTLTTACYNVIRGRVFEDMDQSCAQNGVEAGVPYKILVTTAGYYGYCNASGDYMILTPEMSTTVRVSNGYPYNYSLVPSCTAFDSIHVSFSQPGDTVLNTDFGLYADPNFFDLGIHPGWSASHPGFNKEYWVLVENNSPTTQNAVVTFTYDPALQYDSCNNGGVHNAAMHQIVWTFNNLPPGYHWGPWNNRPMAYFTVPVTVPLNYQLHTNFEITPVSGDVYPPNNVLSAIEPVTGSHDPNEKSVIPWGVGPTGDIQRSDSTLLYTIHFQNNGNDTAFTVVVADTLSSNLDVTTLVPGASSHTYTLNLSGQGVMTWRFDHILLPDSTRDPIGSNGYFNYTIRQKPNLPFGSEIRNTAYIYFDFNSAIVTNTTLNTIVPPVGLEKLRSENGLILYPNPAANEVVVQFETKVKGDMQLRIYSIVGTLVKQQKVMTMQAGVSLERLDISGLQNGLYLVEVSDGNTRSVKKLVIQK